MATKKKTTAKATLKEGITLSSPEAEEAAKRLAAEETVSLTVEETEGAADEELKGAIPAEFEGAPAGEPEGTTAVRMVLPQSPNCKVFLIRPRPYNEFISEGQEFRMDVVAQQPAQFPPDQFIFQWSTEFGYFKVQTGTEEKLVQKVENSLSVQFLALGIEGDQIEITLAAKYRNPFPPNVSNEFRRVCIFPLNVRTELNAIDDSIRDLNETIKATPNFNQTVPVSLQRTSIPRTGDVGFWLIIRKSTQAIGFDNYARFMDLVLCGIEPTTPFPAELEIDVRYLNLLRRRALPFNDTDAYRLLKVATEAFLLINGGVQLADVTFEVPDAIELDGRIGGTGSVTALNASWTKYLNSVNSTANPIIPYLALVNNKFGTETLKNQVFLNQPTLDDDFRGNQTNCLEALGNKLIQPFLVELIWSYWHEEGMLVQAMNAIARRFQNVHSPNFSRDPLANLEIDPLRPLNNLLWGYVQDEQHRLSLIRRVHEYKHLYGIGLQGKAVPKLYPAESRSKFIEAFHQLLHLCSIFFKQDDDTTVNSDGFPLLNALREVHLILSQGAHNQFGDLPATARQEMLIQQWLLARPEFREFLPTRNMVAYPEPWMDRVDAMKSLQGWTDISIDHFNRLAVFGEQILLSIRFGAWSTINQSSASAANWARFWRAEIQGYIHDYRAVTGVDLTSSTRVDSVPPSVHLFNRYMAQARR